MLEEKLMDEKTEELSREVAVAMEEHELKVYYQPKYDALTSKLIGAEALVRWIKKDGTMVMPGSFIPQLEEGQDILALDWYMLREVCSFLKKQKEESVHSVPVAVNFSRMHVIYEKD